MATDVVVRSGFLLVNVISETCAHLYILTLGCGSLRHLKPGDQVPEIQQMVPGVIQWKEHRMWLLMELYFGL